MLEIATFIAILDKKAGGDLLKKEIFKYRVETGKWSLTTFGIVEATDEEEAEKILRDFYDKVSIIELRRAVLNDVGVCEVYTDPNYVDYAD